MNPFHQQIRPTGGDVWAHVFENRSIGLPRNLYWALHIKCEPIHWEAQSWDCSVSCEWLTWPIQRWVDLDGKTLEQLTYPSLLECSFYFADHHPVRLSELSLRRIATSSRFSATLQGEFGLHGFGDLDDSNIAITLSCELDFSGVIVVPSNLEPKPADAPQARLAVQPFLDTDELQQPLWDRFRYVLAPRS